MLTLRSHRKNFCLILSGDEQQSGIHAMKTRQKIT
jgi:hypothetical protein